MDDLLRRVDAEGVVVLSAGELARLLATSRLLVEEGTGVAGPIRVLAVGERVLVQEQTDRGEALLRGVGSVEAARAFVARRHAAYERLWDG